MYGKEKEEHQESDGKNQKMESRQQETREKDSEEPSEFVTKGNTEAEQQSRPRVDPEASRGTDRFSGTARTAPKGRD